MRNLFIFLLSIFFIGMVCESCNKTSSEKDDQYQAKMDSIQQENNELNEFLDALSYSIDTIAVQEGKFLNIINVEDGKKANKEQIYKELDYLQNLIKEQKARISQLEENQKNSESAHAQKIQKIIKAYEQQLAEKEARIAALEAQLNQKDLDIASLSENISSLQSNVKEKEEIIDNQTEVIENQDALINEAYVIVGTKKELQEMDILTSSGLFKKAKLNIANISADKFDKVDVRYFTEMPISGKKPKILSQMPANSYSLEKTGKDEYLLRILNPKEFWSISNFLIIQN